MSAREDPRDSSLETRLTLPTTWPQEANSDALSTASMMSAALIMMTRNRFLAWPSLLVGIGGVINAHPTRSKEGGGGFSSVVIAVSALLAAYLPLLLDQKPASTL